MKAEDKQQIAEAVQDYVEIRNAKSAAEAQHKAVIEGFNEALDGIEAHIKNFLDTNNLNSIKTAHGTAFKKIATYAKINDRAALLTWLKKNDQFNLVTLTANKAELATMLFDDKGKAIEGATVPPGIKLDRDYEVQVRKT